MVSHDKITMINMKNINKGLCEVIGWIDNPSNKFYDDVNVFTLILNSKVPDIDIPGSIGWGCIIIDDFQGRHIIDVYRCGTSLFKT